MLQFRRDEDSPSPLRRLPGSHPNPFFPEDGGRPDALWQLPRNVRHQVSLFTYLFSVPSQFSSNFTFPSPFPPPVQMFNVN